MRRALHFAVRSQDFVGFVRRTQGTRHCLGFRESEGQQIAHSLFMPLIYYAKNRIC